MIRSRLIQNSGGCRRSQTAWLAGGGVILFPFGQSIILQKKKKKKKIRKATKKKFGPVEPAMCN